MTSSRAETPQVKTSPTRRPSYNINLPPVSMLTIQDILSSPAPPSFLSPSPPPCTAQTTRGPHVPGIFTPEEIDISNLMMEMRGLTTAIYIPTRHVVMTDAGAAQPCGDPNCEYRECFVRGEVPQCRRAAREKLKRKRV